MGQGTVLLIILMFCGILICGCSTTTSAGDTITIGVLLPLTGEWASKGPELTAAVELAASDLNDYYRSIGSEKTVKILVKDSGTDPARALAQVSALEKEGIRVVIGPATSAEMEAVRDFANTNGMLLVGYASTSPSLSIPGDSIYRVIPDDRRQAEATAALFRNSDLAVVVPVYRDDIWAGNLLNATTTQFSRRGGTIEAGLCYPPGTSDFQALAIDLNSTVAAAKTKYGDRAVGVYYIGFDEAVPLFTAASAYPGLYEVRWFGSDGIAKLPAIVKDRNTSVFAERTMLLAPLYGEGTMNYYRISDRISSRTGSEPDAYAISAYDAVQVAAETLWKTGKGNSREIAIAFEGTSDHWYGATGWLLLNENGDRAFADYDIWGVESENGSARWIKAFRYQTGPDEDGYLSPV